MNINKFLPFISFYLNTLLVFLFYYPPIDVGLNMDYGYYLVSGKLGQGHDLALLISKPMSFLINDTVMSYYIIPTTFILLFSISIYYLLSPITKYAIWSFVLSPLIASGGFFTIIGQTLSISLFYLALGVFIRNYKYKNISIIIILLLSVFAHVWSGIAQIIIFMIYLLWNKKIKSILMYSYPLIIGIIMYPFIDFPFPIFPKITHDIFGGIIRQLFDFTNGFTLLIMAIVGLYILQKKKTMLSNIFLFSTIISFIASIIQPRALYFIPIIPLVIIYLSHVLERNKSIWNYSIAYDTIIYKGDVI